LTKKFICAKIKKKKWGINMIISTQTDSLSRTFGDREAVRILAENGFDAIDYSMFYMTDKNDKRFKEDGNYCDYFRELRAYADKCKIPFNQTHPPFPSYIEGNNEYNDKIFKLLIEAIRCSAILGAKYAIIHPNHVSEGIFEKNMEFYKALLPYAKEYNVVICLENMFGWKDRAFPTACGTSGDFVKYLDYLDSDYFKACLDIGHAGISGQSAAEMIHTLGHDRLKALHVHDNDNIHDMHTLPFTCNIDWNGITKTLTDINYTGEFTFEADNFLNKMPDELKIDASAFMLKVGKYLTGKINN
jgi:sugar phosphate isomerase/epimerase